jgi:predicted acylesterase/phospholipase RssA
VEASKTGVVNVKAEDESYEIYVDGGFVGNTPAKVKLAEGAHVVEVKKAGFKDYRKPIKITEGAELTLRAVLEKQ